MQCVMTGSVISRAAGGFNVPLREADTESCGRAREGGQVAEVEIECQDDAIFGDGGLENIGVRSALHPPFTEMRSIVALDPEPLGHA